MINQTSALNAYRSHELSIEMKTSSGDVINLDFENTQQMSLNQQKDSNSQSMEFSFSSLQQFNFSIDSNGIDEQDKKEIAAFMKIAQPYIDNFMAELKDQKQVTPANKIAQDIGDILAPLKDKDQDSKNFAKGEIVAMFDNALKANHFDVRDLQKDMLKQSEDLLSKIIATLDDFSKLIYG